MIASRQPDRRPRTAARYTDYRVHSIHQLTSGVLAEIVRKQPSSPARTSFAWQLAVGPALARSTTVTLADGVVTVHASDPRWCQEITRARDVVLGRLQHLLGTETVKSIRIER
jgi:predicted nucleic acid-binding Zn ribbon protein